jgi:hypothetical protein
VRPAPRVTPASPQPETSPSPDPFTRIVKESPGPEPSPAFSVIVERGSEFEIPLQGSAWNYLGTGGKDGVLYLKRRYEGERVVFRFRAVVSGAYLLEFTREDVLVDEAEKRWVAVIVEEPHAGAASPLPLAIAAASASPAQPAASLRASSTKPSGTDAPAKGGPASGLSSPGLPAASSFTASAETPSAAERVSGAGESGALALLQADIDAGRFASARELASAYSGFYPDSEEFLWYAARAAEGPGKGRDILKALGYYQRLVREYPEGRLRKASADRIEWIRRSFLDIR